MKIFLALIACALLASSARAMTEEERMKEYHARGYEWPLKKLVPDTEGWKKIYDRRFKQIQRIEDSNAKYNGWVQSMSSAVSTQNFTENGWGLTRAPTHLVELLQVCPVCKREHMREYLCMHDCDISCHRFAGTNFLHAYFNANATFTSYTAKDQGQHRRCSHGKSHKCH